MAKYHVNPETGKTGICKAQINVCRFGEANHFATPGEANVFAETQLAESMGDGLGSVSKIDTENLKNLQDFSEYGDQLSQISEESVKAIMFYAEQDHDSDLSVLPVDETDEDFEDENESGCDVERLILSDGSVGYFKPISHRVVPEVYDDYSTTAFGSMLSELNSYKLSEALGFHGLVPETRLRFHNGLIGSIQREGAGEVAYIHSYRSRYERFNPMDKPNSRQAVIFDYVAGALDRHDLNYLYDPSTEKLTLIDNGFNFPWREEIELQNTTFSVNSQDSEAKISEDEKKLLQSFLNDKTSGGLDKTLNKSQLDGMRARIQSALDEGVLYPKGFDYIGFDD